MTIPVLPPHIDLEPAAKKAVITAVKSIMSILVEAGHIKASLTYPELIAAPLLLYTFIQAFKAHRDLSDAIVKPLTGEGSVRDDDIPLICGPSLNQIQHLLVKTSIRKAFEQDQSTELVTQTVEEKVFFIFKRHKEVTVERTTLDPLEERKVREILKYMAFDWQLPLFHALRTKLNSQQIMEIGDALVALNSLKSIDAVSQVDGAIIKKARTASGADFMAVLTNQPKALAGIAMWNQDMYSFLRTLLGKDAWTFFARDQDFFNVVVSLDKSSAKILGTLLCTVSSDNLMELQRLGLDKLEVMVKSLAAAFGPELPVLLANNDFGRTHLRKLVDNLAQMTQDKDKLMLSFGITCKAMVSTVQEWLITNTHANQ